MAKPVRGLLGNLTGLLLKAFRLDLLSKEETVDYLNIFQIDNKSKVRNLLFDVPNQSDDEQLVFARNDALTEAAYVWDMETDGHKVSQLPYGAIRVDDRILCTDYPSYHLVKNFITNEKRVTVSHDILLAPWSHFCDGIIFGGYYDFMILVAAKLCRMKEALLPDVFARAVVAYPLFKTTYEQELLATIGIDDSRIFDSRTHDVQFAECILGNSGHWFYPHPADIRALKKHVEKVVKPLPSEKKRIYVSRAGRRRVINEASLTRLLEKYDFTIVEDKPRSLAEQVNIYRNASFILGPHGASFTNIVWCEPGTQLFELFGPSMVVDHFRYLAQLMDMPYTAYRHVLMMNNKKNSLEEDIFVSIPDLERSLDRMLGYS